jgi:hypothetical protein
MPEAKKIVTVADALAAQLKGAAPGATVTVDVRKVRAQIDKPDDIPGGVRKAIVNAAREAGHTADIVGGQQTVLVTPK